MPNWCGNSLTVIGKEKDLQEFETKAIGKVEADDSQSILSLNSLFPIPEELINTVSPSQGESERETKELENKYGYNNWYDWCVNNWGTKWDLDGVSIRYKKKSRIKYDFMTAWAPPVNGFAKVSEMFPNLEFELAYDEPGMGFKGKSRIINGEIEEISYKERKG